MSDGRAGEPGQATTSQRVRELFAASGFRRFFSARVTSQFGDGLFQIAAADVLLFSDRSGNPTIRLLAITAITLIPFSAVGPFTGVFIDRWERHKILTRVPLARAVAAALAPAALAAWGAKSPGFWLIVLFVLSSNRFFLATMGAVLPQFAPQDRLIVANSVSTTGGSIANVAGLGLGSALSGLTGSTFTGLFAAAGFAVAAFAAHRVPVHRGLTPVRAPLWDEVREVLDELREGLQMMRSNRRVVYAMTAIGLVQLLVGALTAVLVFYFIRTLDLSVDSAFGLLAILAVGIGIGVVAVPAVARRVRHDLLVPLSFAVATLGALYAGLELTRGRMIVGTAFVGISYAFAKIPVDTIVQEEIPDHVRGRAFSVYDMLFNVARVSGIAIAAAAYEIGATSQSLVRWYVAVYVAAALGFAVWERKVRRDVPA